MLTVAKVTATSAAGYADYLEGKTRGSDLGDYYLRDGERAEAPGRWVSRSLTADPGAPVSGEVLRELMAVRHPSSGAPLRPVGSSGEAVAAIDSTFSAPKSVSAVWALSDPQTRQGIETAHEQAIDTALAHALGQVPMIRRRLDPSTVVHQLASDVVATSWRHSTSRPVDGRAADPQLHSHVLLHAAVRADGRLMAIDARQLLVHRREIGAAYRSELARQLHHQGYEIVRGSGRGGRYFEIAGIPQELLDEWSSRHHQIRAAIDQRIAQRKDGARGTDGVGGPGGLSPAEERSMALLSRAVKGPVTHQDLDRVWKEAGLHAGLCSDQVQQLAATPGAEPLTVTSRRELVRALTEFDATFTDRDARAVTLELSAGAELSDALAVLDGARDDRDVIELADGQLTTRLHRSREHHVLAIAEQLNAVATTPMEPALTAWAARRIDAQLTRNGGQLSVEQRRALDLATGERQVTMIEGHAGTGKSTVLQAVALVHHHDGGHVIVTSTGGLAAQRLTNDLHQAGVPATGYSTAALHRGIETGLVQLDDRVVIIHDEAALASTLEQHQLLHHVAESGARLILVGDPEQSQPVGAGGLWPRLQSTLDAADARTELSMNLRAQNPADRRDQLAFRNRQHHDAIRGYHDRGRVHIHATTEEAEDGALRAAHADRSDQLSTIVIAQTSNEHLDELNARAQHLRLLDWQLGEDSLPIPGRPYAIHAGDQVQIRHNLRHPDHGQITNGSTATIERINENAHTAELRLDPRTVVELDADQIRQADLRLAYVQHPFPAQGATTDTSHLITTDLSTQNGTYVAITRPRQNASIHAALDTLAPKPGQNPVDRLADTLSRDEPDIPSINIPLAHENTVSADLELAAETNEADAPRTAHPPETTLGDEPNAVQPAESGYFARRLQAREQQNLGHDHDHDHGSDEQTRQGWQLET